MKKILFFCFLFFSFSSLSFEAKIVQITGNVQVNSQVATMGMSVSKGDIIEAKGKKSHFIVEYSNGTKFLVKAGKIELKNLDEKSSIVKLLIGKFVSFVKKKSYDSEKFKVETSSASFGVRGTKFWIKESRDNSYLCVCEGVVSASKSGQMVYVKKNEDVTIFSKTEKLKVSKADSRMLDLALRDFELLGEPVED